MRCPTIRAWAIAILASIATLPASAQTGAANAPVLKCEQLAGFKIPNSSLVITKVESIPEAAPGTVKVRATLPDVVGVAVPSHCRAEGEIDQRTGIDGKPFSIGFAIALPDRWNGRFLFQGGGGLNCDGAALPGRSRPLCAWPQHAHYKGQGDQNDAANFECRS